MSNFRFTDFSNRYNFCFLTLLISVVFLYCPDAIAQMAEVPPPLKPPSFIDLLPKLLPVFVLVFVVFHFMVIKPQQMKAKKHDQLLGELKKGDSVITSGGIVGKVSTIETDFIYLEIANNVRIKVDKFHIDRKEKVTEKEKNEK